jgi:hypothetical protein
MVLGFDGFGSMLKRSLKIQIGKAPTIQNNLPLKVLAGGYGVW